MEDTESQLHGKILQVCYQTINYSMVLNRLRNLEKRLQRNSEIAKTYQDTISKHFEKGYIKPVES